MFKMFNTISIFRTILCIFISWLFLLVEFSLCQQQQQEHEIQVPPSVLTFTINENDIEQQQQGETNQIYFIQNANLEHLNFTSITSIHAFVQVTSTATIEIRNSNIMFVTIDRLMLKSGSSLIFRNCHFTYMNIQDPLVLEDGAKISIQDCNFQGFDKVQQKLIQNQQNSSITPSQAIELGYFKKSPHLKKPGYIEKYFDEFSQLMVVNKGNDSSVSSSSQQQQQQNTIEVVRTTFSMKVKDKYVADDRSLSSIRATAAFFDMSLNYIQVLRFEDNFINVTNTFRASSFRFHDIKDCDRVSIQRNNIEAFNVYFEGIHFGIQNAESVSEVGKRRLNVLIDHNRIYEPIESNKTLWFSAISWISFSKDEKVVAKDFNIFSISYNNMTVSGRSGIFSSITQSYDNVNQFRIDHNTLIYHENTRKNDISDYYYDADGIRLIIDYSFSNIELLSIRYNTVRNMPCGVNIGLSNPTDTGALFKNIKLITISHNIVFSLAGWKICDFLTAYYFRFHNAVGIGPVVIKNNTAMLAGTTEVNGISYENFEDIVGSSFSSSSSLLAKNSPFFDPDMLLEPSFYFVDNNITTNSSDLPENWRDNEQKTGNETSVGDKGVAGGFYIDYTETVFPIILEGNHIIHYGAKLNKQGAISILAQNVSGNSSVYVRNNNCTLFGSEVSSFLSSVSVFGFVAMTKASYEIGDVVVENNIFSWRDPKVTPFVGASIIQFIFSSLYGARLFSVSKNTLLYYAPRGNFGAADPERMVAKTGSINFAVIDAAANMENKTVDNLFVYDKSNPMSVIKTGLTFYMQGVGKCLGVKKIVVSDNIITAVVDQEHHAIDITNSGLIEIDEFIVENNIVNITRLKNTGSLKYARGTFLTLQSEVKNMFFLIPPELMPPAMAMMFRSLVVPLRIKVVHGKTTIIRKVLRIVGNKLVGKGVFVSAIDFNDANISVGTTSSSSSSSSSSMLNNKEEQQQEEKEKEETESFCNKSTNTGVFISKNNFQFQPLSSSSNSNINIDTDPLGLYHFFRYGSNSKLKDRISLCFYDQHYSSSSKSSSSFILVSRDADPLLDTTSQVQNVSKGKFRIGISHCSVNLHCNSHLSSSSSEKTTTTTSTSTSYGAKMCGVFSQIDTPQNQVSLVLKNSSITLRNDLVLSSNTQQQQQENNNNVATILQNDDKKHFSKSQFSIFHTSIVISEIPFGVSSANIIDVLNGASVLISNVSFITVRSKAAIKEYEKEFLDLQQQSSTSTTTTSQYYKTQPIVILRPRVKNVEQQQQQQHPSLSSATKPTFNVTSLIISTKNTNIPSSRAFRIASFFPSPEQDNDFRKPQQQQQYIPAENVFLHYNGKITCTYFEETAFTSSAASISFYEQALSSSMSNNNNNNNNNNIDVIPCPSTPTRTLSLTKSQVPFCAPFRLVTSTSSSNLVADDVLGETKNIRWYMMLNSQLQTPAPLSSFGRIVMATQPPAGEQQQESVTNFKFHVANLTSSAVVVDVPKELLDLLEKADDGANVFDERNFHNNNNNNNNFETENDNNNNHSSSSGSNRNSEEQQKILNAKRQIRQILAPFENIVDIVVATPSVARISSSSAITTATSTTKNRDSSSVSFVSDLVLGTTLTFASNLQTDNPGSLKVHLFVSTSKTLPCRVSNNNIPWFRASLSLEPQFSFLSASLSEAASVAASFAAVLALPIDGGLIATSVTQANALVSTFLCTPSKSDRPLHFLYSPLQSVVVADDDASRGKYLVGAVYGNTLVIFLCAMVLIGIAAWRWKNAKEKMKKEEQEQKQQQQQQQQHQRNHNNNNNKKKEKSSTTTNSTTQFTSFSQTLGATMFPSLLLIPMLWLTQGTISSSVGLLFLGHPFVSLLGILQYLICTIFMCVVIFKWLPIAEKQRIITYRNFSEAERSSLPTLQPQQFRLALQKLFPNCLRCQKSVDQYHQQCKNKYTVSISSPRSLLSRRTAPIHREGLREKFTSFLLKSMFFVVGTWMVKVKKSSSSRSQSSNRRNASSSSSAAAATTTSRSNNTARSNNNNSSSFIDQYFLLRCGRVFGKSHREAYFFTTASLLCGIVLATVSGIQQYSTFSSCSQALMFISSVVVCIHFTLVIMLWPQLRNTANVYLAITNTMVFVMCVVGLISNYLNSTEGYGILLLILALVRFVATLAFFFDFGFLMLYRGSPFMKIFKAIWIHIRQHQKIISSSSNENEDDDEDEDRQILRTVTNSKSFHHSNIRGKRTSSSTYGNEDQEEQELLPVAVVSSQNNNKNSNNNSPHKLRTIAPSVSQVVKSRTKPPSSYNVWSDI